MNTSRKQSPTLQKLQSRIGIILLAVITIWTASRLWQGSLLGTGTPAPGWNLKVADERGNFLSLDELKGHVVVLDFWSTTCPPCIREIDELNALTAEHRDKPLRIVGITAGGETMEEVLAFKTRKNVGYPLVLDDGSVSNAYKVQSLPTVYILDKEGKIVFANRGFVDGATLRNTVGLLLDL